MLTATTESEVQVALDGLSTPDVSASRFLALRDEQLARHVRPHLLEDEQLLWVGQPDPSWHFTPADVFLVPFSLLWGGFACFWEGSVLFGHSSNGQRPPIFVALFGLAFVLAGLYFIFGRFIYKAHRARHTVYGVTKRRLLSVQQRQRGDILEAAFINSIPAVSTRVSG